MGEHTCSHHILYFGLHWPYSLVLFCTGSEYGWRWTVLFGYSTWAESIGFSLLGFWVLRRIGIKFGWSRAVHRLCPGEKDGELGYRGTRTYGSILPSLGTQLFVSERYCISSSLLVGSWRRDKIFRQWWKESRAGVEFPGREDEQR